MRKLYDNRGRVLKPLHEEHEPIPGDIEARLTKPREAQPLFQVFVDAKEGGTIPVSPKMLRQSCDEICSVINKAIIDGKRREWANAHVSAVAA